MLLFAINLQGYGQPVTNSGDALFGDDPQPLFSLPELKEIAGYLNEVEYLRAENKLLWNNNNLKDRIIIGKDNIIAALETKDENWRAMIKEMEVPWYKQPVVVMTGTAFVVAGIFYLLK